jgi:hypothetical protein
MLYKVALDPILFYKFEIHSLNISQIHTNSF